MGVLDELDEDLYPLLRKLRETEPVAWVPELNGWLVTRYDLAVAVLKDAATFTVDDPRFTTARVTGPSMLSLDGPEHTRHRTAFARTMRPADLNRAFVAAETRRLVDAIRPDGRAELRRSVAGPLAAAVMADLLGLDQPASMILRWYQEIVAAVAELAGSAGTGAYRTPSFGKIEQDVVQAVSGEGGRGGGRRELLTAASRSLTTDEVVSNAAVLLFGGIETTEGMIANAIVHALTFGELARGGFNCEESLRLEPAAAMVDRYATRDVTLGGSAIAAGDQVTVSITGANRDPAMFPDPDAYLPSRANAGKHLAFAHGPHFCIGAHLARLETELAVAEIMALPGLRLVEPAVPRGVVFRKPQDVSVTWD
jgi:cytochrome P450